MQKQEVITEVKRWLFLGDIPERSKFLNLCELSELVISDKYMVGHIPATFSLLSKLEYLNLSNNHLSGIIPPELSQLSKLSTLALSDNQLTGNIPTKFSQLSNLTYLNLSNNQLSGNIPPELSQLSQLTKLVLSNNQLSGLIPPELSLLSKLELLSLSKNQLKGSIPPELSQLPKVTGLYLNHNQLTSYTPPELGEAMMFKFLCDYLNEHKQTKNITPELAYVTNLQYQKVAKVKRECDGNHTQNLASMLKLVRSFNNSPISDFLRILDITNTKVNQLPEAASNQRLFIMWYFAAFHKTGVHITMVPSQHPDQRNTEEQVKAYYELIQRGISEAKRGNLFVVGQEGVGKTTMVKNIIGEAWSGSAVSHKDSHENLPSKKKTKESKRYDVTDGVDRHQWVIQSEGEESPITMTLQDFAGQAIYQETHSFLLNSSDSIVVLMFDISVGLHENRVAHWIYTLSSRVPGALLFIVASHVDRLNPRQSENILSEINNQLESLYYDLNASICPVNRLKLVSPSREQGGGKTFIFWTVNNLQCTLDSKPALFLQLEQSIQEHVQSRQVPQTCIDFHDRLQEEYQKMKNDTLPLIRGNLLENIANEVGLHNKEVIIQAIQVISGWGNVLFFPDDIFNAINESQNETQINFAALMNLNWLIKAFKSIISVTYLPQASSVFPFKKKIKQNQLKFKQAQVSKMKLANRLQESKYQEVSEEETNSVLTMLQCLNMIVPVHGHTKEEFFIPSMLCGIQPVKLKSNKKEIEIIRSYGLRFLPSGLFSRFMVSVVRRFGSMKDVPSAWDGGFVMIPSHSPENEIRVLTETNSGIGKTIHMHVLGDGSDDSYQGLGTLIEILHQQIMFLLNDMEHGNLQIVCTLVRNGITEATGPFGECLKQSLSRQPSLSHDYLKYLVPEIYLSLGTSFYKTTLQQEYSPCDMHENYQNFCSCEIKSNQLGTIVTLKRLGQGVQGFVDLGEVKSSSHLRLTEKVAVKFPFPDKLDAFEIENLMKEVSLLRLLHHTNLVRLLDVVIQPLPGLPLAIVAEFCPGGDLEIKPGKERIFDVLVVMRIARDIAAALGYLHSRNPPVLHLDVSGRNVFLVDARVDARVCAVLGDVGCAQSVHHETKRVGNWSIGSDVTMFCSFLQQLMTSSVSKDQNEHPAFSKLEQLCNEMNKEPDVIQFTHIASSLDQFLSNSWMEPKICYQLRNFIQENGGVEGMDLPAMVNVIELLAPEEIVFIKDGESLEWKSVCKTIYPLAVRAVKENLVEIIDLLASVGFVDVGNYNDDGNYLLHIASLWGRDEIMSHVLRGLRVDVNVPNRHHKQHRALHFAASFGKIDCISLLLDYWAVIDAVDTRGQTALFKAAEGGHFEVVQLLALRGANVNVVCVDSCKETTLPIISAARGGHHQCVTELLRFGANISSIQEINITASEKKLIQNCSRLLVESSRALYSPIRLQSIKEWLKI